MNQKDPLRSLVLDAHEFDRELIAEMLRGRIGLDPERGEIVFLGDEALSVRQRVVLTLLGQRALSLLNENLSAGMAPKRIGEVSGIVGGSVRPVVRELAERGLLVSRQGEYLVPGHAIRRLGEIVQEP